MPARKLPQYFLSVKLIEKHEAVFFSSSAMRSSVLDQTIFTLSSTSVYYKYWCTGVHIPSEQIVDIYL